MQSLARISSTNYKNIYGEDVEPRVLFVATFKDKVPHKEDYQKTPTELEEFVKETKVYHQGMIVDASETQMVFTINNLSDEAEEDAKKIRNAFEKIIGCFKISTPYPWLIFSILVQHVYGKDHDIHREHRTDGIISYNECFKLAQECEINSFEAALQFLHKQTGILYYYKKPPELSKLLTSIEVYLKEKIMKCSLKNLAE